MISIIIPAYNEEKIIERTLKEYADFFKGKKLENEIKNFEIIVVLNACQDNTETEVKKIMKKYKEIRYLNFKKNGKGFAVKEGFKEALKGKTDLIGFVDADLASPPAAFYYLIKNIGKYNAAMANRYHRKSIIKTSLKRKIVSRVFNLFIRIILLLPYQDTQCGCKLFKTKVVEKVLPNLGMDKWAFDIDLVYNVNKLGRIKEVPTIWGQGQRKTKMNVKRDSLRMFLAVIQFKIKHSFLNNIWWFFKPFADSLYRMIR